MSFGARQHGLTFFASGAIQRAARLFFGRKFLGIGGISAGNARCPRFFALWPAGMRATRLGAGNWRSFELLDFRPDRQILEKMRGFVRAGAAPSQRRNFQYPHLTMQCYRQYVARRNRLGWSRDPPRINPHISARHELCGKTPRPRKPRKPKPFVEPLRGGLCPCHSPFSGAMPGSRSILPSPRNAQKALRALRPAESAER